MGELIGIASFLVGAVGLALLIVGLSRRSATQRRVGIVLMGLGAGGCCLGFAVASLWLFGIGWDENDPRHRRPGPPAGVGPGEREER